MGQNEKMFLSVVTLFRVFHGFLIRIGWIFILVTSACAPTEKQSEIWFLSRIPTQNSSTTQQGWYDEISAINPVTNQIRQVYQSDFKGSISLPSVSPDGMQVAFKTDAIWLANTDSTALHLVAPYPPNWDYFWLDDHRLVLMQVTDLMKRKYQGDWVLYDTKSGQMRVLTTEDIVWFSCGLEGPGSLAPWIAFNQNLLSKWVLDESHLIAIPQITLNTDKFTLTDRIQCPAWTPDGKRLVISARPNGHTDEIFLLSDGGKVVKQLTHFDSQHEVSDLFPNLAISPDGNWIVTQGVFNYPLKQGIPFGYQIILVNSETGDVYYLGERRVEGGFVWSPDSKYVAVGLGPKGSTPENNTATQINVIDVSTKEIKQLTSEGGQKKIFDWKSSP